jgi:hypothetical protein
MPPLMVGAANPGKAFMKVSTLEIFLHHFVHHRANQIRTLTSSALTVLIGRKCFPSIYSAISRRSGRLLIGG